MKAYIISIGDELLIGQVINKNAAYIASKMNQLSVDVIKICDIPDNIELIKNEIDAGFKVADLVLVTGGLGPTHDDVTREAIVSYFNTELVLNEDALENVKKFLEKRKIEFKKIHESQGYLPKIAEMIPNSKGTAPGMWIKKDDKYLAVMPGVPIEMKAMVDEFICSRLRTMIEYNGPTVLRKTLLTTGLPESELYLKLGDIDELLDGASLAFLPSQFGVRMRITVEGKTREEASDKLLLIEQKIRGKVGRYIYGVDNSERGGHRHKKTIQAAICLQGKCTIYNNNGNEEQVFELDIPEKCLIIKPEDWHTMYNFSKDAILMVLASDYFDQDDYIFEKYPESNQK